MLIIGEQKHDEAVRDLKRMARGKLSVCFQSVKAIQKKVYI